MKKEYTERAIQFAKDTKEWGHLDEFSHYTTGQWEDWKETSDNAHGGIDLSWAFHENKKFKTKKEAEYFIKNLLDEVQCGVDDEWNCEDFQATINRFS